MQKPMSKRAFFFVLIAMTAAAQTPVTTSGGTTSTVPLFTGSSTIGNSVITQSSGNIAVNGSLNVSGLPYLNGLLLNYGVLQNPMGPGPTYYEIATLPASGASTLDHLHLVVTVNAGWISTANSYIDAVFANRNGFLYQYTLRGAQVTGTARLVAYENSDTSVNIYLNLAATSYGNASYTILENYQETVYWPPLSTSTTPTGTLVFDSSNSAYQPAMYSDYAGNFSAGSVLHLAGNVNPSTAAQGAYVGWNALNGGGWGETDFINNQGLGVGGFAFMNTPSSGTPKTPLMFLSGSGNLGVGTTSPGAKLEVNGSLKLTSGSGGSITFADGTVQTTASTGVGGTCGGDYAESVDVTGSRSNYEPGDVLVISPDAGSDVSKSGEPYSTVVAGIYSTKPGIVGRRQTSDPKTSKTEVPMAMVGIVPTKVSAENGPISRGDLLVTSSIAGYAMKGTDRNRMLGAVIGKALGSLDYGTGVIEIVVTLQ